MTDGPAGRIDRAARGSLSRRGFLGRAAALGAAVAAGLPLPARPSPAAPAGDGDLSAIGIEEHYATPELLRLNGIRIPRARLVDALTDVGAGRIAAMDEAGIAMQVLSAMTPGAQELPGAGGVAFARGLNRRIAGEVVARRPDRFRALAVLPRTRRRRRTSWSAPCATTAWSAA